MPPCPLRQQIVAIAEQLEDKHHRLTRRATEHARYVSSVKGTDDLSGGAFRLEVALALASRQVVTPRITPDGEAVGVRLIEAVRERAVVMWRTHADTMPDEAAALSVLALADLHDAAERAGAPWTLLLDEFGAVIKMAAQRGVAILQRGRSHGGQVVVITQSAADIEALTGQPGLLASLTDNFTGIVAHRQTSPESAGLARETNGHPRALAKHPGDQRKPTRRPRERPPRPRIQDRSRRVQHPAPRRSDHLHPHRRRPRPNRDPAPRPPRSHPTTDHPDRRTAPLRGRSPPRRLPARQSTSHPIVGESPNDPDRLNPDTI